MPAQRKDPDELRERAVKMVLQIRARDGKAHDELDGAVRRAPTLVQSARATWTRSDLMKQLALVMPAGTRSMAPGEAVALLHRLTGEALAGWVEQVVCLEAPPWLSKAVRNLRATCASATTRVELSPCGSASLAG